MTASKYPKAVIVAAILGGGVSIMTFLGMMTAGLLYVFTIRADFDAFVAAHIQHEENCENEREHLKLAIDEVKHAVDRLHIDFEKSKYPGRYYNENNYSITPKQRPSVWVQ